MTESIEKKMIYLFIILQPVLDLVTSITVRNTNFPITIGILIRSLFMVYIFTYVVFRYKPQEKIYKYSKVLLICVFIYIIVFFIQSITKKPLSYMLTEIKGIVKLFYFPVVLGGLFIYNSKDKIIISNKTLTYILAIYTGSIFIATITGTYFRSYNDYLYGVGTVGWFFAANEIGTVVAILTPFTIINIIQNRLNTINIMSIILCIWASLYIGTKVPFLGLIGTLFVIFVYSIWVLVTLKIKKQDTSINYKRIITYTIGLIAISSILFIQSPIYKNIMFNYGHIIQKVVDTIKPAPKEGIVNDHPPVGNEPAEEDKVPSTPIPELENETIPEIEVEINEHVNQDDIVDALLSNRSEFANEIRKIFNKSTIVDKLLGLGHVIEIEKDIYTDKTIEMDHLDIFYRYGIVGTIIYFSQLILIMFVIGKNIVRNPKILLKEETIASILSIGLGISIAFVSGHVLTAPGVSIFIIISIMILYNYTSYYDGEIIG